MINPFVVNVKAKLHGEACQIYSASLSSLLDRAFLFLKYCVPVYFSSELHD